jgi:hypothetical protein
LEALNVGMQRLDEINMKINLTKCHFRIIELSYLELKLTPGEEQSQAKTVEKAKIEETKDEIKLFVGL